jgi:hypothetical protein
LPPSRNPAHGPSIDPTVASSFEWDVARELRAGSGSVADRGDRDDRISDRCGFVDRHERRDIGDLDQLAVSERGGALLRRLVVAVAAPS